MISKLSACSAATLAGASHDSVLNKEEIKCQNGWSESLSLISTDSHANACEIHS